MKAIDWNHIASLHGGICDRVMDACEKYNIKELMGFRYDWNTEIIAQFHASFYFSNSDSTMHWTTDGIHFAIDVLNFSCLFGLGSKDLERTKIHNERKLTENDIRHLYLDPNLANRMTSGLKPYFYVLNNLFTTPSYLNQAMLQRFICGQGTY